MKTLLVSEMVCIESMDKFYDSISCCFETEYWCVPTVEALKMLLRKYSSQGRYDRTNRLLEIGMGELSRCLERKIKYKGRKIDH